MHIGCNFSMDSQEGGVLPGPDHKPDSLDCALDQHPIHLIPFSIRGNFGEKRYRRVPSMGTIPKKHAWTTSITRNTQQ